MLHGFVQSGCVNVCCGCGVHRIKIHLFLYQFAYNTEMRSRWTQYSMPFMDFQLGVAVSDMPI